MLTEQYPGDAVGEALNSQDLKVPIAFPDPFLALCFFDPDINNSLVTLYPWQMDVHKELVSETFTSQHPCKYCLIAANGSGKDKYVIAPLAVWFILCKVKSRVIITTASGTQLTNQTEPYIKNLVDKINAYFLQNHGFEAFRVRQRYIQCLLTGSEIRMFATDEKGRAEGYHPIEANSEMMIIVNEGKTVSEDIHSALRRCTGYNYWLEVSSAGEPSGFFYRAATTWPRRKRITSYDCPHLSKEDIETDINELGEHSAFFRSKHLSLFTSVDSETVISEDSLNYLLENPPQIKCNKFGIRVGIDLAAGGDENVISIVKENKAFKEIFFRQTDTTVTALKINEILIREGISKSHQHIYADDGGIGRSIIDMLCKMNWNINRVMNQWAALGNKKQFGNRGAENWYRAKRMIEEKVLDISNLSPETIKQLKSRHYKQSTNGGRIFLRPKKEEIAEGFKSPDRADAFVIALTGLTADDYIEAGGKPEVQRVGVKLHSAKEVEEYYENKVTFASYEEKLNEVSKVKKRGNKSVRYMLSLMKN